MIKLIMGDGRLIKPLGVLRNLNVAIAGKEIPTDFFVINASDDEHESIILGKPFLKLVNAILDLEKGLSLLILMERSTLSNFIQNRLVLYLYLLITKG